MLLNYFLLAHSGGLEPPYPELTARRFTIRLRMNNGPALSLSCDRPTCATVFSGYHPLRHRQDLIPVPSDRNYNAF